MHNVVIIDSINIARSTHVVPQTIQQYVGSYFQRSVHIAQFIFQSSLDSISFNLFSNNDSLLFGPFQLFKPKYKRLRT